jgi:hypothetical protein
MAACAVRQCGLTQLAASRLPERSLEGSMALAGFVGFQAKREQVVCRLDASLAARMIILAQGFEEEEEAISRG